MYVGGASGILLVDTEMIGMRVDVASTKQCIGYHPHHHPRSNSGIKGIIPMIETYINV